MLLNMVVVIPRVPLSPQQFIDDVTLRLHEPLPAADWQEAAWTKFCRRLTFVQIEFAQKKDYQALKDD